MPAPSLIRAALVFACVALGAGAGEAQDAVRVEAIRTAPEDHVTQIRTLEGVVERLVSQADQAEPAFYLEDDFGHQLLVVPFGDPPARGARVVVTGVVSLDEVGDPVLTVFDDDGLRVVEAAAGAGAQEEVVPPEVGTPARFPRGRWLLGVGALVVIAAGWMFVRGRGDGERFLVTGNQDVDFATSAFWPESERTFEGRTLRFVRPDPTVRILSARLEVVGGGDAGEEIRFFGRPDEPVQLMFGRAPGEGEGTVHLKQKTVSRTHAVIRLRHGEWLLENLSMTNPTVLNGAALGAKERLLTDGDRIEMGEVVFVFRA